MTAATGDGQDRPDLRAAPVDADAACAGLSERFGGAVVALVAVNPENETATPVAVHDPDPDGLRDLRYLLGAAVPLEGTICGVVWRTGVPAQVGPDASLPDEALPDGWLHYSRQHGIEAAVVLPLELGRADGRLLVVSRRLPQPFEPDEIAAIADEGRRLLVDPAGPGADAPPAEPDVGVREPSGAASRSEQRRVWAADVVIGAVPPVVVAATLGGTSDPGSYRPTALLVLAVTALGLVRGRVAAAASALVSLGVIWWFFTPPFRSAQFEHARDAAGLAVLAVALAAMWALVDRVDRARRKAADAAGLAETLIDEMPVAFALAGPDRRLRRVNQRFADLTGGDPHDLVGGLPSMLHPATGARTEGLVQQVLDEGEAVLGTVLETDRPEAGIEHTWRVNHFPVRSGGDVASVGMTVEDITEDVVTRRRAQLLLRLSRRVAGATSAEEVASSVTEILAEGLRARCLFAVVDPDGGSVTVVASAGYHDADAIEAWSRFHLAPGATGTLATSLRASELVLASVDPAGPASEDDAEVGVRRRAGDRTVAWQPVVPPGSATASAAIGVSWPYDRHLTEHSRTLLQTAASVSGMALARVELTDLSARDRVRQAMDAMLDQVILARSIRDGSGTIVDFEIDFANQAALDAAGRTLEAATGRRVRELYPGLVAPGLFDRFCQVVETGVPWEEERLSYRDPADGRDVEGWLSVQVMRVDDGYLAASRDVTEVVRADRLAREARAALEREHLAVGLLQRAALPTELPIVDGVDVGAHYRPAAGLQPVGGDWYDAFLLEDGVLALVVADVAGHGQEAAAYMLQVRNIFRAVATEHVRPEQVLERVDHVLQRLNEPGAPFVTCCYATLDLGTWELRWALAGHPPPVLAHADGTTELCATEPGPPLSTLIGSPYHAGAAFLDAGDLLVLYTDGLVERRGELIDDGIERLSAQLRDRPHGLGNEAVATHLADLVPDPTDDIAILCVSPTGGPTG